MAASVTVTKYSVLHQYENFNCLSFFFFPVSALTQIYKHQLKGLLLILKQDVCLRKNKLKDL